MMNREGVSRVVWIVALVMGRKDDAFLGLNIDLGCKKVLTRFLCSH
jgi:hypothetical protein